jgi:hypothetical protein
MTGSGHVGALSLSQVRVPGGATAKLLDPQGRDIWFRVKASLAAQLGQGTGLFLSTKQSESVDGDERTQIVMQEEATPLGATQALWVFNSNANTPVYVWVEFWGQEPPEKE